MTLVSLDAVWNLFVAYSLFFLHHRVVGHINTWRITMSLLTTLTQKKSPLGTPWPIQCSQHRCGIDAPGLPIYHFAIYSTLLRKASITLACAFNLPSGEVASNSLYHSLFPTSLLSCLRSGLKALLFICPVPLMLMFCQHLLSSSVLTPSLPLFFEYVS